MTTVGSDSGVFVDDITDVLSCLGLRFRCVDVVSNVGIGKIEVNMLPNMFSLMLYSVAVLDGLQRDAEKSDILGVGGNHGCVSPRTSTNPPADCPTLPFSVSKPMVVHRPQGVRPGSSRWLVSSHGQVS